MPTAERHEHEIRVQTTYQERHLMGSIPGARYKRDLGCWVLPLSWASCIVLRSVFQNNLEVGERLTDWAWAHRSARIEPAMEMRNALVPKQGNQLLDKVEKGSKFKLFPYQRVDAEFMAVNSRALLANPPGLGKTGATIRTLQLLEEQGQNPYPALIVCPNSLKFTVWEEGFQDWAPELKVTVIDGPAGTRRKQLAQSADVYVINWDGLRLHSNLAPYGQIEMTDEEKRPKELNELGHRTAVFDEAHRLKDPRAKQTRAAWAVAHQAFFRFTLTGTPTANDIGDLWSLLHCLEPTWFPAKTKFLERYAQMSHNYFGGAQVVGINPSNRDELFKLIDPLMRRLPKEAALPQLPPKLPVQYRHTPMTPAQQKAYDQMRDMMMAQLNEILVAPNPLSKLTRLLQFASASAEITEVVKTVSRVVPAFDEDNEFILDENGNLVFNVEKFEEYDTAVTLTDPSSKVDDMMDLLEEMGEEPLVVAAVSRQLIELAAKRLEKHKITYGLVTGAQTPLERQAAVKQFQDGKLRVILLTLGAGAEGITLTRANTMLFMQRSWSEIQNQQAEDRVHRIGSEGHAEVRIIEQITPNSVEENKRLVLEDKQLRMEEVVRDRETLIKLLGEPKVRGKKRS